MKNFTVATIALAMTLALPLAAQAAQTARKTEAQLKVDANVVKFCTDQGKYVATAQYVNDTENKVAVTCSDDAAGLAPLAGLGGLGLSTTAIAVGGVVLAAVAVGGNDGPSDTQ